MHCSYYPKCGGCQLQHLSEAEYRTQKQAQLADLFPEQKVEFIWGGPASRRRAELKVDASGNLGFYEPQSHDVVAIDHCPAVVPEIDALLIPLKAIAKQLKPERIFVTVADTGIELVITMKQEPKLELLTQFAEAHDIARIVVNKTPVLIRKKLQMMFAGAAVDFPPGAFLQPTKQGQQVLTETIDRMIPKAKKIAEFFCGMGTYTYMLAEKAPVLAYEFSKSSIDAIKHPRIKAEARDIERFPVQVNELNGVDVVVMNPPRNGCAPQCKALTKAHAVRQIVMVSCHPHTLARDIKILSGGGFKVKEMIGLDQFHWTHHLESIVRLER